MNAVQLEGRVVWDPRVNTTGSGKVVTNFSLEVATGRGAQKSTIRCVAWKDSVGEAQVAKGEVVRAKGRLTTRSYEKNGQKVEVTEVVLESLEKVTGKSAAAKTEKPPVDDDEIPF